MRIKFGEWLPDLADFENPGSTLVKNVIPFQGFLFTFKVSQSNIRRINGKMPRRYVCER